MWVRCFVAGDEKSGKKKYFAKNYKERREREGVGGGGERLADERGKEGEGEIDELAVKRWRGAVPLCPSLHPDCRSLSVPAGAFL